MPFQVTKGFVGTFRELHFQTAQETCIYFLQEAYILGITIPTHRIMHQAQTDTEVPTQSPSKLRRL